MLIDKIQLSNVKGISKSYELEKTNLIHGDNGSGKTAILDAIRLALLGYHPKLGKTGKSIFSLSSSTAMSCSVRFDDGQTSCFDASTTGSSVSKNWTGVELEDNFKLQLDPSLFFDASLQERRNSIFSVLSGNQESTIKNKVLALVNAIPNEGTIDESQVIEEFKAFIDKTFVESKHSNESLLVIIEKAKKLVSMFREDVRVMDKTLEGLAQINDTPTFEITSVEHYENLKNAVLDKIEKTREILNKKKQIENEILSAKIEIDEIEIAKSKKADPIDPAPFFAELRELQDAHNQEKAVIESKILLFETKINESKSLLSLKMGEDMSFEEVKKIIPEGNFNVHVEVLNEGGSLTTSVWKIESFDLKNQQEEITKLSTQLNSLNQAYHEACAPLEQKINEAKQIDSQAPTDLDEFLKTKVKNLTEQYNQISNNKNLESDFDALHDESLRLEEAIRKASSKKIDSEKIEKARKQSAISGLRLALAKTIQKAMIDFSQDITDSTLSGLLSSMNKFANGIDLPNYAILDGEIGYYSKSTFVPSSTFSGSEFAILRCAATIALAMNSMYKIAIIDELGRFDADRKIKTLKCLKQLTDDGDLSQFIVVDVISPLYDFGINIISI
jgi:energy-coupling factor transporter ATP-binding protein EcfA2